MTTITVHTPVKVARPRAARWIATALNTALDWVEHRKAIRTESRLLADRIAEASAVREYARRYADQDPRFAADLLAAADRHEIIN